MSGDRTAVMILHPSFDDPQSGKQAAIDWAENLINGFDTLLRETKKANLDPQQYAALREELSTFEVKIRKVGKDLL